MKFKQIPNNPSVLKQAAVDPSTPGNCYRLLADNFGFQIDVTYQVLDQRETPQPILSNNMIAWEMDLRFSRRAIRQGTRTPVGSRWKAALLRSLARIVNTRMITVEDLSWFLAKGTGRRGYFSRLEAINVTPIATRRSLRFIYDPKFRMLVVNYYPYGIDIVGLENTGQPTDIGLWVPIPSAPGSDLLQSGNEIFPLAEATDRLFQLIRELVE